MSKGDAEPGRFDEEDLDATVPAEIIGRSPGQLFWRRFRKDRWAIGGMIYVGLVLTLAIIAPVFAKLVGHPYDAQYIFEMTTEGGVPLGPQFHNEAGTFLFGADLAAHDLFVRVLYGARTSLRIALGATVLEVALGLFAGILAGFYRGKVDTFISRTCDVFYSLPTLLLIIGLVSACAIGGCLGNVIRPGALLVALVIGLFGWPYLARIIRGQVLSIREKEFVEAARSLGAGNMRIMFREILPNVLSATIVYTTLLIPINILVEAGLSFLGVGVSPTTPSWGAMISQATGIYRIAWWTMVFPGLFLLSTTLAFNLVGDGLRDAFDPRMS